ncbi:zf-TFIIB domain-containing protein [Chloroflexota bacterium]
MICPTCHNITIVVEQEKIELDYCTDCSGVWFDSGELELMLELMGLEDTSLSMADILLSPEFKTTEKKLKCPMCNQKMKKVTIGREPHVLIDVCPEGDGLWFEGGEVSELITQHVARLSAKLDSQERIITFLGDTFKAGVGSVEDS